MKATEFKCPACGAVPTSDSWEWELVEPATSYRRLAIEVTPAGEVAGIQTQDLSHDEGVEGASTISHKGCNGQIKIPEGFWSFDVYG